MERRPDGTDGLRLEEEVGDLAVVFREKEYKIKEVGALQAMEALITKEADSMSAMTFRMMEAENAL